MEIPENTIKAVSEYIQLKLSAHFTSGEIDFITKEAMRKFLELAPHEMRLNLSQRLSESELLKFIYLVKDLKKDIPLQYILGEAHFYDLDFEVDENVLIPRPETEELVHLILNRFGQNHYSLLDVGTGSGCIAVSLKVNRPEWNVAAIDKSPGAINVAKRNAGRLDAAIDFEVAGIEDYGSDREFDIVVSNPPYIDSNERESLDKNVVDHEPHLALFAPENKPLYFYDLIADKAKKLLRKGGLIFFETHYQYGDEVVKMLEGKGYEKVELIEDLSGNPRIVAAEYHQNG
ncbi:peptide chain release factor N(5)-glutamine methyltransferase [Salibacter sp.]|uniref:peptide chain release factor N(5)-glutamine methyltransferase n=1 Tax=Salibacter sp. TaxID=2010995 RepID=UPI00286FF515|nr:peptide chain release factor N(5)-glutamine methyltransferase [Salibacter sp.]MDR9488035.1 peptide chain release factor N(5)-glutamine methyltransferase [Salibacter sp.]